jgi:hypothetical protein
MPKVEQNGMPTSLHYTTYVQTLNVADLVDRMEGDFDVINQQKYPSRHCNQDYAVRIDTVKVQLEKENSKRLTGR